MYELGIRVLAATAVLVCQVLAAKDNEDRLWLKLDSNKRQEDSADEDQRLTLTVSEHHPCDVNGMKIEFGTIENAPLLEDLNNPGCYIIGSQVEVSNELGGELQMYVESTQTLETEMPNDCEDYNEHGCGGSGGACLHCKNCTLVKLHEKELKKDFSLSLLVDGEEPACSDKLGEGSYDNIELRFCLPTRDEYLKSQGYNPETFNKILEATSESDIDVYLRVFIFDFDVTASLQTTRRLIDLWRISGTLPQDEPPSRKYWLNHTPFGRLIKDKRYIGCHLLVGKVGMRKLDDTKNNEGV